MNSLKNRVQLIGHLGVDPELKNLDSGKHLTKFSLATNESYKNDKGELVQATQWHNIVAWGKLAENISNLLKKGSHVAISGKLTHRSWEDTEGVKRYTTEVLVGDFVKLTPKEEAPF